VINHLLDAHVDGHHHRQQARLPLSGGRHQSLDLHCARRRQRSESRRHDVVTRELLRLRSRVHVSAPGENKCKKGCGRAAVVSEGAPEYDITLHFFEAVGVGISTLTPMK
jgi:hypothetical protein